MILYLLITSQDLSDYRCLFHITIFTVKLQLSVWVAFGDLDADSGAFFCLDNIGESPLADHTECNLAIVQSRLRNRHRALCLFVVLEKLKRWINVVGQLIQQKRTVHYRTLN